MFILLYLVRCMVLLHLQYLSKHWTLASRTLDILPSQTGVDIARFFFINLYVHTTQSIQSTRLSFQSSELGPLNPSPGMFLLPPLSSRGGDTLACGGRGGRTQFRRRDRHCDTQFILKSLYAPIPILNVQYNVMYIDLPTISGEMYWSWQGGAGE